MISDIDAPVAGQSMIQSRLSADSLVAGIGAWTGRAGPRYSRLADAVEALLVRESTPAGCLLPTDRELAKVLGVSRGTVVAAYAELAERGVVARRQGSGTRVLGSPPTAGPASPAHHDGQFGRFLVAQEAQIDLAFGAPYVDDLVWQLQGRIADVMRGGMPVHGYAPFGLPALREGVAARMTRQGAKADPDEVIVTSGAQGAVALLTALLVRPGDRVIVEAPTYPGAIEVFSRAGASIVALERDHAGPRPDDLRHALSTRGAAFVFLVPTCHNPTGGVMHEQRRRELLRVCREHDVLVIEDLTTADIVFDGEAPPTLAELAGVKRVVTVGSFSKVLWGGLRVGWIRGPRALVLRLGRLRAARDLGGGSLDQAAVVAALGDLDEIIVARRRMASERHDRLRAELEARMPEWTIAPSRGGYSLWVQLPSHTGEELAAAAMTRGVAIAAGSNSGPEDRFIDHVRLCHPAPLERLTEAAARLEAAWQGLVGSGRMAMA
jgi:DNA-binding transcriptional MocR family regulator